jgi:hypothetical protein
MSITYATQFNVKEPTVSSSEIICYFQLVLRISNGNYPEHRQMK